MLFETLLQTRSKRAGAFRPRSFVLATAATAALAGVAVAQTTTIAYNAPASPSWKWVASWTTAAQGVLSSQPGSPSPDLAFAIPDYSVGAQEQTFRLIIKPDLWENEARLRLTNLFGTQPVTFESVTVAWQSSPGDITPRSLRTVTFGGKTSVTIPAGQELYSDSFELVEPINANNQLPVHDHGQPGSNSTDPDLDGRKLAINLYIKGTSGPITYHQEALQTSYLSAPNAGDRTHDTDDNNLPYTTTSWFFLGALEVKAPADTKVIVATGASVVDGTLSTLNGNDRWSDDLSRRVHEAYGRNVSVVNTGLSGDTAALPPAGASLSLAQYFQQRLNRDVINVAGVTDVILYDGPNDYGSYGLLAPATIAAYQTIVSRVHGAGLKIYGATLSSPKGDPSGGYGTAEGLANRLVINAYIRTSGLFDGVEDFDAATYDPSTGGIWPQFVPNSTTGGTTGDYLHPNRAGYQAEANSIDITPFAPTKP
jgi:lysophospholipase L1-like esterase